MWLSDFRIVLPDQVLEHGSLRVEDGCIAEVADGVVAGATVIGNGRTMLPGIVDLHGDMLEREIEPRPKAVLPIDLAVFELDKRLVATGITTAFTAVSFHRFGSETLRSEERARQIIDTVMRLHPLLHTDFKIHARFEMTNPDAGPMLTSLMEGASVHLVSLTDHTPGQGQYGDIEKYIETMIEWRRMRTGELSSEADLRVEIGQLQARAKNWDVVNDIVRVARSRRIPLASHDDDSEGKVEFVAGLGATISEFPITIESARAARARGMHTVMGAPNALLGRSHSHNLSALDGVRADLIDILAADYHPASLIQSAYSIAMQEILPLHEATKLITLNPANAAGLSDRGSLQPTKRADIVLVDEGVRPRVRGTLKGGRIVYWDGSIATVASDRMAALAPGPPASAMS